MLKKVCLLLLLETFASSSSYGASPFDLTHVSYSINCKLEEASKTLSGIEKISFFTGERSYKKLYLNILQHYHPNYFSVDSVRVDDKSAVFKIPDTPDKDLLEITPEDSLSPHSEANIFLRFSLRFGDNAEDYNAGFEGGNFYCQGMLP